MITAIVFPPFLLPRLIIISSIMYFAVRRFIRAPRP
jgi:hypothetical protein